MAMAVAGISGMLYAEKFSKVNVSMGNETVVSDPLTTLTGEM